MIAPHKKNYEKSKKNQTHPALLGLTQSVFFVSLVLIPLVIFFLWKGIRWILLAQKFQKRGRIAQLRPPFSPPHLDKMELGVKHTCRCSSGLKTMWPSPPIGLVASLASSIFQLPKQRLKRNFPDFWFNLTMIQIFRWLIQSENYDGNKRELVGY